MKSGTVRTIQNIDAEINDLPRSHVVHRPDIEGGYVVCIVQSCVCMCVCVLFTEEIRYSASSVWSNIVALEK